MGGGNQMRAKIIFSFLILAFVILGCSSKGAENLLDPRNGIETESRFSLTRSVDANSQEGEELVNFKWGEHNGELKYLKISIEYLDYFYKDEGGYPVYYIGLPMRYKIILKNTGCRTFEHLEVIAIQEYYESM